MPSSLLRKLRPRRTDDDRGSVLAENAVITIVGAGIFLAVANSQLGEQFNEGVRQMVCLVRGPSCDMTWVEHDRPDEPEEFDWGFMATGGRGGDNAANKALGMELAAQRGFTGQEWSCLETLWSHESNWDHTARNPSGGASGIPQLHPSAHSFPPGYHDSPRIQIEWGLDYIQGRYGTPCAAWAFWQDPWPKDPRYSTNWY